MAEGRIQRRVERLLDAAEQRADERDWAEVRSLAEEALALDAGNADATDGPASRQRRAVARLRVFCDGVRLRAV